MVTPLACGVDPTWRRLINGESGISPVERIDVSDLSARIAGQIPRGDGSNGTYNPDQWMEPKEQRKVDEFIVYAMCAAKQALDDAGWKPESHDDQCASGVMIGSGIGGAGGIADTGVLLKERGPRRVSPFFVPGRIINMASGYVSIEHGLKGPNSAVVTACSTGSHAIGDAGRMIALGDADVMVAGGTESPINRISMAGFAASRAALRAVAGTVSTIYAPTARIEGIDAAGPAALAAVVGMAASLFATLAPAAEAMRVAPSPAMREPYLLSIYPISGDAKDAPPDRPVLRRENIENPLPRGKDRKGSN